MTKGSNKLHIIFKMIIFLVEPDIRTSNVPHSNLPAEPNTEPIGLVNFIIIYNLFTRYS